MAFWNRKNRPEAEARSSNWVTINGNRYPLGSGYGGMVPDPMSASRPRMTGDLAGIVAKAQPHSVFSAAVLARSLVMSQLWFRWADRDTHTLFGNRDLAILEDPGGVTMNLPRLLMQAEQAIAYTGNAFFYRDVMRNRLRLLRADHVTIILGSDADPEAVAAVDKLPPDERREAMEFVLDADVVAYEYKPHRNMPKQTILPEFIAHWAPQPHPLTPYLGSSWAASAITELLADLQIEEGIDKFYQNGMTPRQMFIMEDDVSKEDTNAWREMNEDTHAGMGNTGRNLYAVGGYVKDVKTVGSTLKELEHKAQRGDIETRMAVASRVPASILGISEGMQSSALNSNTYGPTRRMWADGWFTPHAGTLCRALEQIIPAPKPTKQHVAGGYLSHDPNRIMFLQEDQKDAADITNTKAGAMRTLVDGGFTPESVVAAINGGDLSALVHSGKTSVQLLEPGAEK